MTLEQTLYAVSVNAQSWWTLSTGAEAGFVPEDDDGVRLFRQRHVEPTADE